MMSAKLMCRVFHYQIIILYVRQENCNKTIVELNHIEILKKLIELSRLTRNSETFF